MLSYYRNSILTLISKLRTLRSNPDDLTLLVNIQTILIEKITYIEKKITILKETVKEGKKELRQKRLPKSEAKKLKRATQASREKIKDYQWLLFIFRTFGDGIAFTYLDKWNIKPLTYKDKSPDIKENAGFIKGKVGTKQEKKLLLKAVAYNVPAIMTDLTNSLRYGDICLLGETIPRLIEVKSSQNKNERVIRQIQALKSVQSYLDTDEGKNIRGFPRIKRLNVDIEEINYVTEVNNLIEVALKEGSIVSEVEPGVVYYISTSNAQHDFDNLFSVLHKPIPFFLNETNNQGQWVSYYPFTLSIEKAENLYRFLNGDLIIVVFVDAEFIEKYARDQAYDVIFLDDPNWFIELRAATGEIEEIPFFRISHHFFSRVAYEFISLKWILTESMKKTQQIGIENMVSD